jgi:predicted O-methyltransferase YrrM
MRDHENQIEEYILSKIDESHILKNIRENTFQDKRKYIQINQIESKILQLLIKMNNIKTVVEIGTLVGYSTIWIADAIGQLGKIYTIEKNEEHANLARKNFDTFLNVELLMGDATEKLQQIEPNGPFDMIFIDANKSGYMDYLNWAEKNIKKNGLIVADNTLLFGKIYDTKYSDQKSWKVINKFNEELANPSKYDSIIIPTHEGLSIAIKKF